MPIENDCATDTRNIQSQSGLAIPSGRFKQLNADETLFWIEMIGEAGLIESGKLIDLAKEANELTAIFVASGKTAKQKAYSKNKAAPISEIR